MEAVLQQISDGILDGEKTWVVEKVQAALDQKLEAEEILNQGMIAAIKEVGQLFEEGEFFVPELLVAARAMQAGLEILKPYLVAAEVKSSGKVVIGTVQGDLHDIGKNLVAMMLEGSAFEIVDLGTDVAPEQFVKAVRETDADVIAMSALLTTTMMNMKVTIDALKEANLRNKVKVMVGGAPLTANFAEEIGADGYAPDANQAVALASSLMKEGVL